MSETLPHVSSKVPARSSGAARVWAFIGSNKDQLTVVFTLLAAIWAFHEYKNRQESERQAETLRYIDRYHGAAYLTARTAINEVLFDVAKRDWYLRVRKDADLLESFVTDNGIKIHVLTLAEVYSNMARCVDIGICSKPVACGHFAGDVEGLYQTFRLLFSSKWRAMWGADLMAEAKLFADSCKPPVASGRNNPRGNASSIHSSRK